MARRWNTTSRPHRKLYLDAHGHWLRGEDVKALQWAINSRLRARGEGHRQIVVDGVYGPATASAASRVEYRIGVHGPRFRSSKVAHGGRLDERAQEVIRWPSKRTKAMRDLERKRTVAWKKHRKELKAKRAAANKGRQATVSWAKAQVGTMEHPAGSNRGGPITTWETRLGAWLVGEPWCGTFAGNGLIHGGVHGVTSRIASVALIEDDARAGHGPFRAWTTDVSKVRIGDLVVLFGRGVHVEIVVGIDRARGVIYTVGGNTSFGTAGSQSNGGCVASRTRSLSDVHGFPLVRY